MKKAISKRIRITKNGKVMRRKMAQGHFRANKSRKSIRGKRGSLTVHSSEDKRIKAYFTGGTSRK